MRGARAPFAARGQTNRANFCPCERANWGAVVRTSGKPNAHGMWRVPGPEVYSFPLGWPCGRSRVCPGDCEVKALAVREGLDTVDDFDGACIAEDRVAEVRRAVLLEVGKTDRRGLVGTGREAELRARGIAQHLTDRCVHRALAREQLPCGVADAAAVVERE